MTYSEFIKLLSSHAEVDFAVFQRRLIFTKYKILGVRTPILRKIAKGYTGSIEQLFSYPDEYYETVFLKLTAASQLPYEEFLKYVDECVSLMDNWALCDSFKARCIHKHKDDFLPVLERIFAKGGEYEQRYPLVVLLFAYMEERYLPLIKEYVIRADCEPYYIHMAVAWLTAEILVKHYEYGVSLLKEGLLPTKTHNKAIQKAIESYRLNKTQKEYLRSLKIKIK